MSIEISFGDFAADVRQTLRGHSAQTVDHRALTLRLGTGQIDHRADVRRHRDFMNANPTSRIDGNLCDLRDMTGMAKVERDAESVPLR